MGQTEVVPAADYEEIPGGIMKQIQRNRVNRIDRNYLLFSLPGFFFFFSIVLIPFFIGVILSFTEWNGVSSSLPFIGIENYQKLFTRDIPSLSSLFFTFRFTITVVIVSNLVGITLALAITALVKGGGLYRVIFFLPNVIGGLILGFIWRFILINGLPSLSEALSLPFLNSPWLGDPVTGFWGLVIVYVWKTAGYLMVIYIASLYSIDSAIIESAVIDGASYWKMLKAIRFPLIMPAITICLFLMLSWSFKLFDVVFSLTGGGPFRSTEIFALNIYNEAFLYNNYGYASAKAVLFFLIVAVITVLQVRFTKRREVSL